MSFYVGDPTANQPKGFVAQPYAQQVATFNPTVGSKPAVVPAQAAGQAGFQIQPQFHQIGQQPQLIAAQPRAISMQHGMMQPMMQYRPQVMAIRSPQIQQPIRLQPQVQQVQMQTLAHQTQTVQYVQPVAANAYQQVMGQQPVFASQALVAAPRQQLRMAPRVATMPVQHVQVRTPHMSHNYRGTSHMGPKPIKATEVKSYLYAWCTQKKLKPDYSYETIGKSPKIRYKCTLTIPGLDYKASEEARSKRDAQTAAAWNFCDEMVKNNLMKKKDLPPRLHQPENLEGKGKESDDADTTGGWTIDNARQRLNRFCMAERISCDFENAVITSQAGGVVANKLTTSKLVLNFKRTPEPIVIETRSTNKKQANANCAVLAVRELFRRGFIEQFGKHDRTLDEDYDDMCGSGQMLAPGQKRKLEEPLEFDENGNWTLETARAKLQDFFAINGKDLVFDEMESGTLQDRQYLFSCAIDVNDQRIEASATAPNKKSAQKKCALEMVVKLYKLKMIEGNLGKRIKPRHGPGLIKLSGSKYLLMIIIHSCISILVSEPNTRERDTTKDPLFMAGQKLCPQSGCITLLGK